MKTTNSFHSQKISLKLAWKVLLALLFLLLTLSLYGFDEKFQDTSKQSAEHSNIVQRIRRSLKSSAHSPNYELIKGFNTSPMKQHEKQSFMDTIRNKKVKRKVRQAVEAETKSSKEATHIELKNLPHLNYKETNFVAKHDPSQLFRIIPKNDKDRLPNGHNNYYDHIMIEENKFDKKAESKKMHRNIAQSAHGTYNQYEDHEWQPYGNSYINIKAYRSDIAQHYQKLQPKYSLQKHFRRKVMDIKQRKPSNAAIQTKQKSQLSPLFRQMKMLWNLFEFFTWIWNALVEYYQYSQQQQQKLQIQTQMHFKKLPHSAKNSSEFSTFKTNSNSVEKLGEVQSMLTTGSRVKRQTKDARLKSYYDFIIVEASHKFWSILEIATIIIVIYSTFAALYFAKLNPLVSKHDYIDYLSGDTYFGNSRHADDIDFDDNLDENNDEDEDDAVKTAKTRSLPKLYEWLPSMSHSAKFILKAIDKLPVDVGQVLGK